MLAKSADLLVSPDFDWASVVKSNSVLKTENSELRQQLFQLKQKLDEYQEKFLF